MDNQNVSTAPVPASSGAKTALPGIIDLIKRAIDVFKGNPWTYIGFGAIYFLAIFLIALIAGIIMGVTAITTIGTAAAKESILALFAGGFVGVLIAIIFIVLMVIIASWFSASMLCIIKERQRKMEIKEAISAGKKYIKSLLWIMILNGVIVGIGMILLIIPGIIFAIWFSFSMYILIWEGTKGMEALKRSKALVKDYWLSILWKFFGAGLIMAVINFILGFIPLIGPLFVSLVIAPIFMIYTALIYEEMKKIKGGSVQSAPANV